MPEWYFDLIPTSKTYVKIVVGPDYAKTGNKETRQLGHEPRVKANTYTAPTMPNLHLRKRKALRRRYTAWRA